MEKTFTNETAYAVLTEVFNKLTERYLNTTELPDPDVWGEDSELFRGEEELAYRMVQVSATTDDNIYLVSQLRYFIDKGEMEMIVIFDGLEIFCNQLDLNDVTSPNAIDDIVTYLIDNLEIVYEQYEQYKCD